MLEKFGYIRCTSCGVPDSVIGGFAHSHNLPKGQYPQFEAKKWNIDIRCLSCHRALDGRDFEKIAEFNDLRKIMTARREHCPEAYNQFVTGLMEVGITDYKYLEL